MNVRYTAKAETMLWYGCAVQLNRQRSILTIHIAEKPPSMSMMCVTIESQEQFTNLQILHT